MFLKKKCILIELLTGMRFTLFCAGKTLMCSQNYSKYSSLAELQDHLENNKKNTLYKLSYYTPECAINQVI